MCRSLMRAKVRWGVYGFVSAVAPSLDVAKSIAFASSYNCGPACTPTHRIRGESEAGNQPTSRIAISIEPVRGIAVNAAFNSARRDSGHSPMNFVVMCRFVETLHWIFAVGLSFSCRLSILHALPPKDRSP